MKLCVLMCTALVFSGSTFADSTEPLPVIHDKAGFYIDIDVAKIISMTDISKQCGVVSAQLDYLDHQGREHVLDYKVQGYCPNDN